MGPTLTATQNTVEDVFVVKIQPAKDQETGSP